MAQAVLEGIENYQMLTEERRKQDRINVKQGAFVAIPASYLVGQIKNISMGGVSFTCVASIGESCDMPVLEIFSKEERFYLKGIPFKVLRETDVKNHVPYSSVQIRRIGGKFGELKDYQKYLLGSFINHISKGKSGFRTI